jgi:hypothetical protein
MATHDIPAQEFVIRNLPTRSVTLYPGKAQIIRDITNISLQPGPNQITIIGLTPTIDEHSVKVEGTGSATITDLSVQLIPNKENYDDIYPPDEESDEDDTDTDTSDGDEPDEIMKITKEIAELQGRVTDAAEKANSSTSRIAMLDTYSRDTKKSPEEFEKFMQIYTAGRTTLFAEHKSAQADREELTKKIQRLERQKVRLNRPAVKAAARLEKEKNKEVKKMTTKLLEIKAEKARIKAERVKFWPKMVYKVVISLDAPLNYTPGSSRRGSVDSLVKIASATEQAGPSSDAGKISEVNLSLSYITFSASWSPRYDLSLNSVACSGILDYCAELTNATSETWHDAKIVLSTSQTTYQGLGDTIPSLQPWHLRLLKIANNSNSIESRQEQTINMANKSTVPAQAWKNRSELFGLGGDDAIPYRNQTVLMSNSLHRPVPPPAPSQAFGYGGAQQSAWSSVAAPPGGAAFGSHSGTSMPQMNQMQQQVQMQEYQPRLGAADLRKSAPSAKFRARRAAKEADDSGEAEECASMDFSADDNETLASMDPELQFEESSFEESGLTTTYDLPSLKTLGPTSTVSKHKIARIEFKGVVFSHIIIPKLKSAAFLKARLRNASKITLLKGSAGLTLDGSFLGQSNIPRCSSGDIFSLPLGVDPAITVAYAKPTVRRSQSGIFSKEDCEVFTRVATITNTKSNAAVELTVLDQVPVSEDERLKIEIVKPFGLKIGGATVADGFGTTPDVPASVALQRIASAASNARTSVYGSSSSGLSDEAAKAAGKDAGKWGAATATAKKGGEVKWNVKINPSRGCKLVLEYEASYPGGESVVSADK